MVAEDELYCTSIHMTVKREVGFCCRVGHVQDLLAVKFFVIDIESMECSERFEVMDRCYSFGLKMPRMRQNL